MYNSNCTAGRGAAVVAVTSRQMFHCDCLVTLTEICPPPYYLCCCCCCCCCGASHRQSTRRVCHCWTNHHCADHYLAEHYSQYSLREKCQLQVFHVSRRQVRRTMPQRASNPPRSRSKANLCSRQEPRMALVAPLLLPCR